MSRNGNQNHLENLLLQFNSDKYMVATIVIIVNYFSQIIFANSIGETCRVVNTLASVPHDGQRGVPFAANCLLLLKVVASKPHFFAMPEQVILFSFANLSIAFHSIWCVTIFSFILFYFLSQL